MSIARQVKNLFATYRLPSKGWLQDAANPPHTPDLDRLQRKANWLVFIYDGMKRDFPQHKFLEGHFDTKNIFDAFTEDRFTMWKKRLGSFTQPVILPHYEPTKNTPLAQVRGSLMRIATPKLIQLDSFLGNGIQCLRKRVNITVPYEMIVPTNDRSSMEKLFRTKHLRGGLVAMEQEQSVRAWLYEGIPEYWMPQHTFKGKIKTKFVSGQDNGVTGIFVGNALFSRIERTFPNNTNKLPYYRFSMKEYDD